MDLFAPIKDGNMDALKLLLASDVDVNDRNDSEETPLMVAAGAGSLPMVHALLEAGADTHAVNAYGFSALGSALWCSHMEIAKRLVEAGAEVSIDQAAALGDLERLTREWSDPFPEIEEVIGAYLGTCRTGQRQVIEWFLNAGIPVDLHPPGDEWGGIGAPGLHHAAENGHTDTVRLLLEHGADYSLIDDVHQSQALAWAASSGHQAVVKILIDSGANIAHQNDHGLTAADLARDNGFPNLAARLVD